MRLEPILDGFSGEVPLFPVPNAVLFPGARLPLQIFEPRYRRMLIDVLRGEGFVVVTLLRDGWDKDYFGSPPVHKVGGLGKITQIKRISGGRYFILLTGLRRVRLDKEVDRDTPYRWAKVSVLRDRIEPWDEARAELMSEKVLAGFNGMLRALTDFPGELVNPGRRLPAGLTLDILAYHLPSPPEVKQKLLEETNVLKRGRMLLELAGKLPELLSDRVKGRLQIFPKPSRN